MQELYNFVRTTVLHHQQSEIKSRNAVEKSLEYELETKIVFLFYNLEVQCIQMEQVAAQV